MAKLTFIIFGWPIETFPSNCGARRNNGEIPNAMFKGVWSFSRENEKWSPTTTPLQRNSASSVALSLGKWSRPWWNIDPGRHYRLNTHAPLGYSTDEIQHMWNCETHSAYEHDWWQYVDFGNNERVGHLQLLCQAQRWVGELVHQISVKFVWQSGWGSANFQGWSGSEGRKNHNAPQCHEVCLSALTNIFMNGNIDFWMHIISPTPAK